MRELEKRDPKFAQPASGDEQTQWPQQDKRQEILIKVCQPLARDWGRELPTSGG